MTFRSDLDALAARHDVLAAEVEEKTKERDLSKRMLDEAQAKARLPVLPNIRVATPCTADWNAMQGDARVRACASCNKNVYNLSEMTRDEAEALIVAHEGRLCVRYYQRQDGTILLKDCTVAVSQKRKRQLFAAGAAALLGGGGFAAYELTREDRPAVSLGEASVDYSQDRIVPIPYTPIPEPLEAVQGGIGPGVDEIVVRQGDVAAPVVVKPTKTGRHTKK